MDYRIAPKVMADGLNRFLELVLLHLIRVTKDAILNDTNPQIINFYKRIQQKKITPGIIKRYLEKEGEILSNSNEDGYDYFRKVSDRFNYEFSPLDLFFFHEQVLTE